MDAALRELPLALLTTLGPMGAGAFVTLFVMLAARQLDPPRLKRLDRLTVIPIALAGIGLACAFAHLANPANALAVLATLGSSPLANEMLAYGVFLVVALAYWVAAMAGWLRSDAARTAAAGLAALAGLAAVIFMGMAYLIPTVPVWDSAQSILQLIGAWLLGGTALGMFLCSLVGNDEDRVWYANMTCRILLLLGAAVLVASTIMVFVAGTNEVSAVMSTTANADSLMGLYVGSIALAVAAGACGLFGKGAKRARMFGCSLALSAAAIFLARLVFYGMQISIGL